MRLEILQVPDCPNAAVLAARLYELAEAWPDLIVTREIVTTDHDAERLGHDRLADTAGGRHRPVRPPWAEGSDSLPPLPRRGGPPHTGAIARASFRSASARPPRRAPLILP